MTVLTPEFDKAVQAPEVDNNWPQTGQFSVAKKCGGWLWGAVKKIGKASTISHQGVEVGVFVLSTFPTPPYFFDRLSPRFLFFTHKINVKYYIVVIHDINITYNNIIIQMSFS